MTFVESDSFDIATGRRATPTSVGSHVATYLQMTRLIVHLSDSMLRALHDATVGMLPSGMSRKDFEAKYGVGSTSYIEGHLHTPLRMDRDISKIRISYGEVANAANATKNFNDGPSTPDNIKENIHKFTHKTGIDTLWID